MRPDPIKHAEEIVKAHGLTWARWACELNAEHAHDDATRAYWRRALESLPAEEEQRA